MDRIRWRSVFVRDSDSDDIPGRYGIPVVREQDQKTLCIQLFLYIDVRFYIVI